MGRARLVRGASLTALVAVAYLGLALVGYANAWTAPATVASCGCGDPALFTWLLSWTPHAVLHGHNPFFSDWANVPFGVNLVTNTGVQLLGLLAAPVTLLAGPVTAYNVIMVAAFATSALGAYAMARRFTAWRPAAFAAGLLFGFSPYMIGHGTSHANLAFVCLVPLLFLAVDEILVRQRLRPSAVGAVLGLMASAQFLISSEILLTSVIVAACTLVYLAATHRHEIGARAGHALRSLAIALGIFAVIIGYPGWMGLAGPERVKGPIQPIAQAYRGSLLGPVLPTERQILGPSVLTRVGNRLGGGTIENGAYLGIPLLVTLVAGVVLLRRSGVVRAAAFVGTTGFVLSLGASPLVTAAPTVDLAGLPLPGRLLHEMPIGEEIVPVRFTLYLVLAAALLFGIILDRLHRQWPDARRSIGVPVGLSLACLLPLVPAWPYATERLETPGYFLSADLDRIPRDSVALVYPFPTNTRPEAMTWQGQARMRFRMPGGYFRVPTPGTGAMTYEGIPSVVKEVLDDLYRGVAVARTDAVRRELLDQLQSWKVRTVIAARRGASPDTALDFLAWVLGRPPQIYDGVGVWYDL